MGLLSNVYKLFHGLDQFFSFFHAFFAALPLVIQVLIYFGFGGVLLLCLLRLLKTW